MSKIFSNKFKIYTLKFAEFKELGVQFISSSVLGGFCRPINNKRVKQFKNLINNGKYLPTVFTISDGYIVDGIQRFTAILRVYEESVKKNKKKLIEDIEKMDFPIIELTGKLDTLETLNSINDMKFDNSYAMRVAIELNNRVDSQFRFKIKIDKNSPGTITISKLRYSKYFKKLISRAKKAELSDVLLAQKIINTGIADLKEAIENVSIN